MRLSTRLAHFTTYKVCTQMSIHGHKSIRHFRTLPFTDGHVRSQIFLLFLFVCFTYSSLARQHRANSEDGDKY